MSNVLALYSGGQLIGVCNDACHHAVNATCTCICGGRNHGVGSSVAALNTRRELSDIIAEQTRLYGPIDVYSIDGRKHQTRDRWLIPHLT